MNKKQKLKNAIKLSLLLSGAISSSAWAILPYQALGTYEHFSGSDIYIENHLDYNITKGELEFGLWAHNNVGNDPGYIDFEVDSLNIDVYNNWTYNINGDGTGGNWAAGILAGEKRYNISQGEVSPYVVVTSKNDVNINVTTRNAQNAFGILANKNGHVGVTSTDGNIFIEASKDRGKQVGVIDDGNVKYDESSVYGVNIANDGYADIKAKNNINIIANGYNKDSNDKLIRGDIYSVYNNKGDLFLKSLEGNIVLSAESNEGYSYGLYVDSRNNTKIESCINYIQATTIGNSNEADARAIYVVGGSKVDIKANGTDDLGFGNKITSNKTAIEVIEGSLLNITGNTYVSGDDGAIVVSGDGINTFGDGEQEKQFIVNGNLTAISSDGAAVSVDNGANMYVNGILAFESKGTNVDAGLIVENGSTKHVTGSIIGQSSTDGVIVKNNSTLTVGGNVCLNSEKIGMNITENSNVTIEGSGDLGTNYIVGKECGINIDSSTLNITDGDTVLVSEKNALEMNNAKNSVIGSEESTNIFAANTGNAIYGKGYSNLTVNGDYNVISTNSQSAAAVKLTDHADVTINGSENYIYGNYDKNGATHSIKADDGSTFTMGGENAVNRLYGVIYTKDSDTSVTLNGSNYIYSSTHGSNDNIGDRSHVVAALYAQSDSNITLDAGENGINYIETDFNFVHDDKDSERTIWAQDGGKITINGATEITASNSGEYTDGHKGNSRGIAITAGTGIITDGNGNILDEFKGDKEYLKPITDDRERSTVTLNYAGESKIIGDIVSGYGGLVNVAANGNGNLDMQGNALAANGGKLSLDLGKGGVWYGRADDYGDAGYGTESKNHSNFYNPAFSNEIFEGGTVDITMGEGSMWVLTGQSWITSLEADNSIIDMAGVHISQENIDKYNMKQNHALVIGEFSGKDSTFIMDLDAENRGQSDMLYIKHNNEGTFNVQLKEALTDEELNSLGENGLRFATISGDNPGLGNVGVFEKSSVVRYAGTGFSEVTYEVKEQEYQSGDNSENDIYNNGKVKANGENSFENGKPGQEFVDKMFENGGTNLIITGIVGRQTGDIGQTIVDMSKANYTNAIYMDRLNKRMGETRFIDGDEGMWVRLRHDRIGKEDSFRSMDTMYEMGYDVKQVKDNGEHRVGVAIDYMDGSTSYSKLGGDGEISRKGIWMYDTWVGEKGHYRDFVAKWGHLSNDFDVYAVNGDNVTGDYSNNVYSISAEFGKKNDIGNNWYFEPQAQLQYAHVTGAEYMTSAGTAVNVDDINSLIARAGFRLGKDLGERSTVYFKADLMHEFLGEQNVFAMDNSTGTSGAHERYDHGGTWCDLGFGFATAMSKTSYAYLDVETSLGNDYDETYQINAGLQWTF